MSSSPSLRPTASAVVRLSPVSMTSRMPSLRNAVTAAKALSLTGSATATSPAAHAVDRNQHHSLAVLAKLFGARSRDHRDRRRATARSARFPIATRLPSTTPTMPLPGLRGEVDRSAELQAALLGALDDGSGERMLAASFEARGEPQQLALAERAGCHDADEARLALGQGSGLVDDQGVDLLHDFERLGILGQHSGARASPGADHDRHRRRQAERARAGDDQHRDGVEQRKTHRRRRADDRPHDEGDQGGDEDTRNEPGRNRYPPVPGSARASAAPRRPC